MRVLIVARTRMGGSSHRCIGGIAEDDRPVRLLTASGDYPADSSPLRVGDIWELQLQAPQAVVRPHVENVQVGISRRIGPQHKLGDHLRSRVQPWRGGFSQLFGGLIRCTANGNGYVCKRIGVPDHSTGFWIPDRNLVLRQDGKHFDYGPSAGGLSYVGERDPPKEISAGTLIRVSLATWWRPDGAEDCEERCYLQLSEWYD